MTDTPGETPRADGGGEISDEMLMAYADGALPPEQRRIVREALSMDPALVKRLESFLYTRDSFRHVFDEVLDAPIPERLLETVLGARRPAAPAASGSSFFSLANFAGVVARFRMPLAAVAAVALLATGWQLNESLRLNEALREQLMSSRDQLASLRRQVASLQEELVMPEARQLAAWTPLQLAFERAPMGTTVQIDGHLTLTPRFTFWSKQGKWCRQVDLTLRDRLRSAWIACRAGEGAWQVQLQTPPFETQAASQPKVAPGFRTAEGADAFMDAARSEMSQGDVLGPKDEEKHGFKQSWAPKK